MTKRKHGIRPPRKPRGENPKVTIANQDRQIKLLIERCEELRVENEYHQQTFKRMQAAHAEERSIFDQTCADLNARNIEHTRLLGWQDCAREMLGLALNSNAPGS